MVPDDSLTIRERAIAAWPMAWGGQNLRDIITTLGYDVDRPWRELPRKERDWLLFTDEQPVVPVYPGYSRAEVQRAIKREEEPNYMGTFTGARRYVLQTFATTQSAAMKQRAAQYLVSADCATCHGRRLRPEALAVRFAGLDITEMSRLPLARLAEIMAPAAEGTSGEIAGMAAEHPERAIAARRIAEDLVGRVGVLLDLGLGYLLLGQPATELSGGEAQRIKLATELQRAQRGSTLYVLDEPTTGLHPADVERLVTQLDGLVAAGNTVVVVEHDMRVVAASDWVIDVGPGAGDEGGRLVACGTPAELAWAAGSRTAPYLARFLG